MISIGSISSPILFAHWSSTYHAVWMYSRSGVVSYSQVWSGCMLGRWAGWRLAPIDPVSLGLTPPTVPECVNMIRHKVDPPRPMRQIRCMHLHCATPHMVYLGAARTIDIFENFSKMIFLHSYYSSTSKFAHSSCSLDKICSQLLLTVCASHDEFRSRSIKLILLQFLICEKTSKQ